MSEGAPSPRRGIPAWVPAGFVPDLPPPGEAHVWSVRLTREADAVRSYGAVLSADEAARAHEFFLERDRDRFVLARGFLRHILALYLQASPEALRFVYEPGGKPRLDGGLGLGFNVAHSGSRALYAVASTPDLGVDVEWVRDDLDILPVARHVCSPDELSALERLAPDAQRQAFFSIWTRKEALVKAWGDGLARRLGTLDVGAGSAVAGPGGPWSLHALDVEDGYAGALALPRGGWRIRRWEVASE